MFGVLAVAALSAALGSCSDETSGTPTATGTTSGTPTGPSSPTTARTETSHPGLAGIDPCELLTADDLAELGFPPGTEDTVAGNPRCEWNPTGAAIIDVALWATLGLEDLNTSNRKVTALTIGDRPGRRLEHNEPGLCDIDIAVTATSSVTVGAVHDQTAQACELAERVARRIEPRFPRG